MQNRDPSHSGIAALALVDSLLVELKTLGIVIPKDRAKIVDRAIQALEQSSDAARKDASALLTEMYKLPPGIR
jgi:hypothetical protein